VVLGHLGLDIFYSRRKKKFFFLKKKRKKNVIETYFQAPTGQSTRLPEHT